MIYDYDYDSLLEVLEGIGGTATVILGANAAPDLVNLGLQEDYTENESSLDAMATGHVGMFRETSIMLNMGPAFFVGRDEFAVIEGPQVVRSVEAAASAGDMEELPSIDCKAGNKLVTMDEMYSALEKVEEVVVYAEIIKGRVAYLPTTKDAVNALFFGRNGIPNVRAYLNARNQLVVCEPVPELEDGPESP